MYRSPCIFQVILGVMTVSARSTRVQNPPKWWQHQHVKQYTAVRGFFLVECHCDLMLMCDEVCCHSLLKSSPCSGLAPAINYVQE